MDGNNEDDKVKWPSTATSSYGVDFVATGVHHPGPIVLRGKDLPRGMNLSGIAELLRQMRAGRKRIAELLQRIDDEIAHVETIQREKEDLH